MHILPPLETVKDIAATQQYDVLPLSCEILSDFITPIEAMRILKNVSTHCYMLESAQADDRWGRYTFLGFDPKLEITCIDGKMKAGGLTVRTDDPSQYLRELLSSYRSPRFDYLPSFTGGLVGYFSYDYLKYSEPSVRCGEQDEDSFKDVDLMLFDKVIAFDHVRQKIVLIVNMALSDVEVGYNKAKLELEQLVSLLKTGEKKQEAPGRLLGEVTPLFSKEQFCAMVETAKHHIREGDIFQIVLSNRLSAPFEGSLLDTYRVLRTINPSPYMFYFSGTDVEVAGASPETLVKLKDGVLHTFPLAGTRPRGKTDEEDKALEESLLHDEKELAEAQRLSATFQSLQAPNSPNGTHFVVEVSPWFERIASSKEHERLFALLPYKTLYLSSVKDRHGVFAFISKDERRDLPLRKQRPSVRAQLKKGQSKKTAAPKKAAAKTKDNDLEV